MSLLDRLRPDTSIRAGASAQARAAEATGAVMAGLTGLWTAALSWLGIALPLLLAWAASGQTTAPWGQAVRVAGDGWLVLHRIGLDVPGGRLAFVPLGLTALPLGLCWVAGRRIGAGVRRADVEGSVMRARVLALPVGAFAVGYALVVVLAAALARGDGVAPVLWQAPVAGLVVPLLGAAPAAVRASGGRVGATLADLLRVAPRERGAVRAGLEAAAALVAVGAVAVAVTLAVHHDRVLLLHRALDPGAVGGGVLTLAQMGLVPNLALWGVSFVAGPGFAVGVGTAVTPGGSQMGLLPLVPVLGAVPPPGELPLLLTGVLLLPVLAGALAGWSVVARATRTATSVRDAVRDALTAAAAAAVALTVLVALSGGSAGPGALSAVGPSAWRVGLVLAGELAVGAAAAAWVTHRRRRG